jgi:DNA-binding NarL/FixJ family response regulator
VRPTVLIVDDHAGFRDAARALLQAEGFDVVGEAVDGVEALRAVARLCPDVVLLDVQLPDLDGFAVAERLEAAGSMTKVVLISSREAASYGPQLVRAPTRGFLDKRELSGVALARLLT